MGKRLKQTLHKRYAHDNKHKKMLNITSHHRNVNSNHHEILRHTHTETAKIKKTDSTNCSWGYETNENSHTLLMGMQNGTTTLEMVWQFLINLNIYLPRTQSSHCYWLPKRNKTYVNTKICMQMFIIAFFVISPNCKWSKCLSTRDWINCGTSIQRNTTQQWKGTNYWHMQQHGWVLLSERD